jgi:hypothetical protein
VLIIPGVPGNGKWHVNPGDEIRVTKRSYDATSNEVTWDMEVVADFAIFNLAALSDVRHWRFQFYDADNEVLKTCNPDRVTISSNSKGHTFQVILEVPGKKTMEKFAKVVLK